MDGIDRLRRSPGAGPWFRGRPGRTIAVATALYVGVLGLDVALGPAGDPVTVLFCLPVTLLAVAFGLRAGLLAGLLGVGLMTLRAVGTGVAMSLPWWLAGAVPMLLLGVLLGDACDRLRRSEEERQRLEAATQRHRDAVEFNDSVVQQLSAAKWALEAGRDERGLEIVTEALEGAQRLVSDLLHDAGMGAGGARGRPVRSG